jgi:hypothetical protein
MSDKILSAERVKEIEVGLLNRNGATCGDLIKQICHSHEALRAELTVRLTSTSDMLEDIIDEALLRERNAQREADAKIADEYYRVGLPSESSYAGRQIAKKIWASAEPEGA